MPDLAVPTEQYATDFRETHVLTLLLIATLSILGCRTASDPEPVSSADEPEVQAEAAEPEAGPPPVPFRKRTPEEREADIRAGIDPDKPLPGWTLVGEPPKPKPRSCATGTDGRLALVVDGKQERSELVADLLAAPEAITIADGRHAGAKAIDLWTFGGSVPVTVHACGGQELAITEGAPGRWLMVLSNQDHLKLLDLAEHDTRPVFRAVTEVHR